MYVYVSGTIYNTLLLYASSWVPDYVLFGMGYIGVMVAWQPTRQQGNGMARVPQLE